MSEMLISDQGGVDSLIKALAADGRQVIGPTIRSETIVYDEIAGVDDLPRGWTDHQGPGRYRLENRNDGRLFGGYVVGPHSWKQFLNPSDTIFWSGTRTEDGFAMDPPLEAPMLAFIGVRPCEIAALGILDRVFASDEVPTNRTYRDRRDGALIVAVNCVEPGDNCFCVSMGTGPATRSGYDIAITEIPDPAGYRYLIESGSETGVEILRRIGGLERAGDEDTARRDELLSAAARSVGKALDTGDLQALLQGNVRHPRWDSVAQRCLSCTNCTMVCPTCFCSTVADNLSLDGGQATRTRTWDSCFTLDFTYLHGHPVREGVAARYRHWMTHKLSTWVDQFGEIGCVGCGRCITWCPAGIDITEEAAAIRRGDLRDTLITISGSAQ